MKILITLFLAVLCTLPHGSVHALQTRDTWRSVRTNHLFVVGNADAEKLRQAAAWLEFFHGAFARIVSRNVLESSVPTTVIIFRDDASFQPFKPLYQGRAANISGFFQPGEDVNYIALSLDPDERNPYATAFHEYVHLHVNDNIPHAPLWLNEGLAELYGALQFSSGEALLGVPQYHYLRLLREQEMLPLETLFSVGTNSPHYNEQEKTGVFYGQSWALVHYLMFSERARQDQFRSFLHRVSGGDSAAKAIEAAYGTNLPMIEQELRAYVRRGEFGMQRITSVDAQSYASYTAMQRQSLSEGEANHYLGDLLLHSGRDTDAERYFKHAIALDPNFLPPYASLGLLCVQQRRYAEAKKYLQKATSSQQSYLIHYFHAYVLSREGLSPDGRVSGYSREIATAIREQLLRSIQLAPAYAPSRYLLALVNLVTGERLDEALEMIQKARQLAPSQSAYPLLMAQIHMRRSEEAAARALLEPLVRDSDQHVRTEAQSLIESMNSGASASRGRANNPPAINSAMIAEPPQTGGTARMLGGDSGGGAIRDGRTIETSGSLPTLDEVRRKYVEAMGGDAAISAIKSRVTKGTVDVVGVSRGGTFEIHAQAPNKTLTIIQAHPLGTIKIGFNGRSGWTTGATGMRMLRGADLASLQRDSEFYGPVRMIGGKVTLAGASKIGYRDVYVIDLQPAVGAAERLYLDAQTYLPVRVNTTRMIGSVAEPVEMYLDDWREVDGVKYPFSMSQSYSRLTLTFTIKEILHNVVIDQNLFEPQRR